MQKILASMLRSEIIIIDSPNYCFEMTGQLKTLFDHFAYIWMSHRPRKEMFSKIGIVISTAAGAGANRVTKSIAKQLFWWGVPKIHQMHFNVNAACWEDVSEKNMQKITQKIELTSRKVKSQVGKAKPNIKTKFMFNIMQKMHDSNSGNKTDRDYWQKITGLKKPDHGSNKMENTKETIIYEALTLFSNRGYEGVSMRDIASAVGIKAASLYNHFKSKEDIFNRIIDEMSKRYDEAVLKIQMPYGEMDTVVEKYMQVTEETLVTIAKNMFLYFLKDDFASRFRRMLTIEQFRCTHAGDVFQNFFIDGAINFQKTLFANMIKQGGFIECDPHVMALHFYSPIFLLLSKYDRLPDKQDEALDTLVKHVKQFSTIYNRH